MKIDFILHWKLFDMIELPDGGNEVSVFFVKMLYMKERTSYYIDTCGIGVDWFANTKYSSVLIRLFAFSINIQWKKHRKLRLL